MKLRTGLLLPSIADFIFIAIFLYLSLIQGAALLNDCDTGYHIRAGEWILANHAVPKHDIFSLHSPPIPWTAHEWLSEVIMALVHSLSGLTGVVVFFSFLLALSCTILFRMIRSEGGNILIAVGAVLMATASSQIHWLARPHVFSILFFVIWYWILEKHRSGSRNLLYLLPLTTIVWVNLHGGFISGLILLGIYLVGIMPGCLGEDSEERRRAHIKARDLSITMIASLVASLVNPIGWHILLFPFDMVSNKLLMDNVSEFMAPNFHEPSPFKYMLFALLGVFALSRERATLRELILVIFFTNMAFFSARHITLFSIIAAPILARHADALLNDSKGKFAAMIAKRGERIAGVDAAAHGYLWPAVAVIAVLFMIARTPGLYGFNPETKPVAAVRFLEQEHIPGNMFNNDEFGDYLIYKAWPRYRVFFDGRSDMYGTNRLKDYMEVVNIGKEWEKTLDKYRINWIFIPAESPLSNFLMERKDWVLIYEDKVADIFIRNIEANQGIIKSFHPEIAGWGRSGTFPKPLAIGCRTAPPD